MPYSPSTTRYFPHVERGFGSRWMPEAPPRARANGTAAMVNFEKPSTEVASADTAIAATYANATDHRNHRQVSMVAHALGPYHGR